MKTKCFLLVVGIIILSSCAQKQVAHNRSVPFGDYRIEVISDPDGKGDMDITITNTEDNGFSVKADDPDSTFYSSQTITINRKSGLVLYEEQPTWKRWLRINQPKKVPIFQVADNFFDIR